MNIVADTQDYVKLIPSTDLTIPPAPFIRCPGCYSWKNPSHMVWVPPGLVDEAEFTVCISCAVTIRHAFAVLNEKTVRDVAAIVTNAINYGELVEVSE